jgi:hypothetical protein
LRLFYIEKKKRTPREAESPFRSREIGRWKVEESLSMERKEEKKNKI